MREIPQKWANCNTHNWHFYCFTTLTSFTFTFLPSVVKPLKPQEISAHNFIPGRSYSQCAAGISQRILEKPTNQRHQT